ncbi:Universal stress protein family [Chelatococcus sambhunathii]|uniref:Universal stress protein family n=1 Tax=Chelatococcus sambhunathii TaxID=363953 RepID=A0ABP2AC01_9HYPH|nr:universal stress protein [Chelatococcus sambhunathii]CUA91051.1 Universal stress protein family [Chelatococcus sambhunathii]
MPRLIGLKAGPKQRLHDALRQATGSHIMIRDILVHLDGSAADETRIIHAEAIAGHFDAHVTGLFTNIVPTPFIPAADGLAAASILEESRRQAEAAGESQAARLAQRLDTLAMPSELRRFDLFADAVWSAVARQARACDLFVALRPYGADGSSHWPEVVEAALFGSGRGVYLAPPDAPARAFETVLVAWSDTREAAHAVAEAMPLLRLAKQVVVATVDADGPPEEDREEPGADLARHLDRHGVRVELRHVPEWREVSRALLNETEKSGADLAVLGAYGHSRLREWVLGGATRDFLTQCPVPMLMAH